MKTCSKCKEEKPNDSFYKRYGTIYNYCIDCKRIINKERYETRRKRLKNSRW